MDQPTLRTLLAAYVADTITAEDRALLFDMLRSPAHQEELERLLDEGFMDEAISGLSDPGRADVLFSRIVSETRPVRKMRWLPYAAAILLLIAAGIFLWPRSQPAVITAEDIKPGTSKATLTLADGSVMPLDSAGHLQLQQGGTAIRQQNGQISYSSGDASAGITYNTLSIPRGGQFNIELPDGSRVWLNAASSLRFPVAFTGEERKVELTGQAYFEIAANASQPFKVVIPGGMEVQVLGTQFDIMAYGNEGDIRTTLLQGSVRVMKGNIAKLLQPGQQALLANDLLSVQDADVNQAIAWKTGFFEFTGASLPSIMRQVERWYDVDVAYQGQYPKETFWGRIGRNLPLSEVLHLMEENGVRFRIEGRKLIVLPRE